MKRQIGPTQGGEGGSDGYEHDLLLDMERGTFVDQCIEDLRRADIAARGQVFEWTDLHDTPEGRSNLRIATKWEMENYERTIR